MVLPLLLLAALPPSSAYPWFKRGGNHQGGSVSFVAPSKLSEPAWLWPNLDEELFRHAPVVDDENSIYALTSSGWLRKFGSYGELLWARQFEPEEGRSLTSPFLHQGRLFLTSTGRTLYWPAPQRELWVWCFDMETGEVLWKAAGPEGGDVWDSHTLHVSPEGVLLGPMVRPGRQAAGEGSGANMIYALNASGGEFLWDFVMDDGALWNFMPSTPGDGTVFFSTNCGVARRLRLHDGALLWHGALQEPGARSCSRGGGVLGPNGVFYAEANHFSGDSEWSKTQPPVKGAKPCNVLSCNEGTGILIAYKAENGEVMWVRRLGWDFMGHQYPAIGKLGDTLAVVVGMGNHAEPPQWLMGPRYLPFYVRYFLQELSPSVPWLRSLLDIQVKRNAIAAFRADTGVKLWQWEEEPWDKWGAAGDEARYHYRHSRTFDPRRESVCGPNNWGIPAIGGDGTVYAASGNSGKLYAIRDDNSNNIIEPDEVSTFDTGHGFMNGPALAPGLLVAAPCWGPMYVWTL